MKRKILTIVLSLAMLVTMMPAAAFAAATDSGRGTGSVPKVEKINGRYIIRTVDSTLEMYKQALRDAVDEKYVDVVKDKSEYSGEVWNKINAVYDAEMVHIDEADDANDLLEIVWIFMLPNDETAHALLTIDCLAGMTKDKINSKTSYKKIKSELLKKCKAEYESSYVKSDYNDFYWSSIQGDYALCIDKIKAIKNLDSYVDTLVFAAETELFDVDFDEGTIDEDNSDDLIDWDDLDDGDDYTPKSVLGVENVYFEYYGQNCTKEELKELKKCMGAYLDAYVNKQLKISDYDGNLTELQKVADGAKKQIADMYDGEEMLGVFTKACNKIEAATDIEMQFIDEYEEALLGDLLKLRNTYKKEDYSSENWEQLNSLFDTMTDEISSVIYRAELPVDVTAAAKKAADSVPTYKQELKALKSKYIKKLNSYIGNAKYKQAKVKPIVAKGKKAIKASAKLDEVKKIYKTYNSKARKTVKKYKITTTKVGKGTITKTKRVIYGKSATVKITPAAGYKISKVYIDGKKKKLKNSYTFKNVKKSHKIKVVFKK